MLDIMHVSIQNISGRNMEHAWGCLGHAWKKVQHEQQHLLPAPASVAHDQGHVLDLPDRGHRAVPRQAQQQVGRGVVLRDLEHHVAVAAVPRHQVLAVDEVCAWETQSNLVRDTCFPGMYDTPDHSSLWTLVIRTACVAAACMPQKAR